MLNAIIARELMLKSKKSFDKIIEDIENDIKKRATNGYHMTTYSFAFDYPKELKDQIIEDLRIFGYTVKGTSNDQTIDIEW